MPPPPPGLDAARRGDERAFRELVAPYLGRLRAHCYQMLGSIEDADDAVQDTLLRAWRGLPQFEGRSSFRAWLYRVATSACLTLIERRPPRILRLEEAPAGDPYNDPEEPTMEPTWLGPFPSEPAAADESSRPELRYEHHEALELAFVAALQHLPPRQRAVLILRDALGFSGAEVAQMLDTIPSSVYSLLQRAHRAVDERVPDVSQQQTLRALGDARLRSVAERYVEAWEAGDAAGLAAMLADEAIMTMPPRPTWYSGREDVMTFLARAPLAPRYRWRFVETRANGQVAFGTYQWDAARGVFVPHGLHVLTLGEDGRIREITAFLDADVLARFGLPDEIAAS